MIDLSTRQLRILQIARENGRVLVDDLAQRFAVSPQTIRKDLNEMCDKRLLARVHGGAILASGTENVAYTARRVLAHESKQRIAQRAAMLIPDATSMFINIGTTTEEVARALVGRDRLLVITNNIHVVSTLLDCPQIEVVVAGGMVRRSDGGIVGEATLDLVSQFKVDVAVIGVSAIDEDGSLLDFDYREVRVAQKIIENARTVVLVADAMKFIRTAPVRIGHISQVDVLVTDAMPSAAFREICENSGVQLEVVDGEVPGDEIYT